MITNENALNFARHWIAAWNSHLVDEIMYHYAEDVEFTSPMIVSILNQPNGKINGKTALRNYFLKGLEAYPDLNFELYHAFAGVNSVVIYYRSVKNLIAAEVFILNNAGKVTNCFCNYKEV